MRLFIYLLQDFIEMGFHNLIEIDSPTRLKLLDYSKPPKHNEITFPLYLNCFILLYCRERSFLCDQCSKSFLRNSHFKSHMKTHTGEIHFSWNQCPKSFSRNSDYKSHMKNFLIALFYFTVEKNVFFVINVKSHFQLNTIWRLIEELYSTEEKNVFLVINVKSHSQLKTIWRLIEELYSTEDKTNVFHVSF